MLAKEAVSILLAAEVARLTEASPYAAVTTLLTSSIPSATVSVASTASQYEPCAQISASQASYASASPSATAFLRFSYDLVRECGRSVPVAMEDAVALIDGLTTILEFQSDLAYKANPPPGYLLAPIDVMGELRQLNASVQSGSITSEIELQRKIQTIYGQAHDGHMFFNPDGISVLHYARPFDSLISVSIDGVQAPKVYFYDDMRAWLYGVGAEPSALSTINGIDAPSFIFQEQANFTFGSYQDPDALYNVYFASLSNGGAGTRNWAGLFSGYSMGDPGPTTSITFENGTTLNENNYGYVTGNFDGVVDGSTFYNYFLNATIKDEFLSSSRASASTMATATATASATSSTAMATQIAGYPWPVAISEDGTTSGYFLTESGFEDTAVLVMKRMSEEAPQSFQDTVTRFFDMCRSSNKTRLILDISANGGGTISLGYDVFKQLFPDLEPYSTFNFRAHEAFDLLGEVVTPLAQSYTEDDPSNQTLLTVSPFSATQYDNKTGRRYQTFRQYYGPFTAPNGYGNYTNLARYNFSDPDYVAAFGSIMISGEANNTEIAPQPFSNENIIILSDGRCGSTCTIMTHFLKYQGKVKAIAMGGRPSNTGPMQTLGGIKGSQVYTLQSVFSIIVTLYNTLSESVTNAWANTSIRKLYDISIYIQLRSASAGAQADDITFNFQNHIADGDTSATPLQFVYEAADCRMYYTPPHLFNMTYLWLDVAANAFGLNGTKVFGKCTPGSTNHPSSLSGNATLYDNGKISNSTSSGSVASTQPGQKSENPQANAASTKSWSVGAGVVALTIAALL